MAKQLVFTSFLLLAVLGCVLAQYPEEGEDCCKGFDCRAARRRLHEIFEKMKEEGHKDPELWKEAEELKKKLERCCGHRPHPPSEKCEALELTCTKQDFSWYDDLPDSEKHSPEMERKLMMFKRAWAYCCQMKPEDGDMPSMDGSFDELQDKCHMVECGDDSDDEDDDVRHHGDRDEMHEKMRDHCCGGKRRHGRHLKKIAIICGVVGGVVLLGAVAVVCFCCHRRRRRHHHHKGQQENTSFENLYYGEKVVPPSLGYVSEKKQPLPEGDLVTAPTSGLKPEVILTAPPSYTENVYDNPSK